MKAYEARQHVYREGPYTITKCETITNSHKAVAYKFESTGDFEPFTIPEKSISKLFNLMDEAMLSEDMTTKD